MLTNKMIGSAVKIGVLCSLILPMIAVHASPLKQKSAERAEAKAYNFTPKDQGWKKLTLREKIGQTMIILIENEHDTNRYGSIEEMIKKYPISGVFAPPWRFSAHKPESDVVPNILRTLQPYVDASRFPLIISEDFELGVGDAYHDFTSMPSEMALGAANQQELSRRYGEVVAREAKALGVNWLLNPVVDLNVNPLNALVGTRAIAGNVERAYPLLKSQLAGLSQQRVISTIKHFPGDGVSMKNQHFTTSSNTLSMAEWNASFGSMYQKLINDGAPSIMVGHMNFPAYQKETIKGLLPPATLSREILVDLLKGEMQFNGVVMSDALNMGGIGGFYRDTQEIAIQAFKAGVDMLLWPKLEFMDEMEARILSGEIPMSRLDDAVERIWGVREQYGLLDKPPVFYSELSDKDIAVHKSVPLEITQKSVTLVSDMYSEIPITSEKYKKIALISIGYDNISAEMTYLIDLLRAKGFDVSETIHNPHPYEWQHKLEYFDQFDKVIVAFCDCVFSPPGSAMLKGDPAIATWTVNLIPTEKLIAMSFGNPYYVNYYLNKAPIKINTYSRHPQSGNAVIDALVGDIPFVGTSPVNLNSVILQ
ncbi:MAG: hypothetical protein COA42_21860 [Alteromonadaceae bacterium]|nr:MAG: hypothetical protein COA42_21860 [Alteromonadaceae bacterium]